MPECYAHRLGDCAGPIEDEHFIPRSIQRLMGTVVVSGLAWQRGEPKELQPGSYAHARIICERHHDRLDGLDGNALAYFRNLMLIANPNHVSSGAAGRAEDITHRIDGRSLEKWCLKTVCGAIATGAVADQTIPAVWLEGLFDRIRWPDEWAIYVETGAKTVKTEDARIGIDFHWTTDRQLNGVVFRSFATRTLFTIERPEKTGDSFLERPARLGATVQRPDGSDVLVGLPAGTPIEFEISWPREADEQWRHP